MAQEISEQPIKQNDPRFRITPVQQMAAACTGALLTSLIMTPLDVVKIRLQAQQKNPPSNKCLNYHNKLMNHICSCLNTPETDWYQKTSRFNGTLDAFMKISRTEGITSLWSGLVPTLILAVPSTVVYYVTYEQFRTRLNDQIGNSSSNQPLWVPLLSGCIARVWAVTTVSPLELVKTKVQSKKLSYSEMREALGSLLKTRGYKGLWKGLSPTYMRDVPFSGIYWVTYEYVKTLNSDSTSPFLFYFLDGSISGMIAALITTPFDVIKTHQQIELEEDVATVQKKKNSTLSMMRHIYNQNGVRGLFVGVVPRVIKVAPACAIMVSSFEYGKSFFEIYNMREHKRSLQTL